MGIAQTLSGIILCRHLLGYLGHSELKELAASALANAEKSHTESVVQYVKEALLEACDNDQERLASLLASIGKN